MAGKTRTPRKPTVNQAADVLRISGKNLGSLALPECCERCRYLRMKMRYQFPYSIWPGIFSSIDVYTKEAVHGHFDAFGCAPKFLSPLGEIVDYVDPPHHSRFMMEIAEQNIMLTGAPDALLIAGDGSCIIADYKTAAYTDGQDELMPMYRTQLNAYAAIAQHRGMGPISGLALIYMEPHRGREHPGEDCDAIGMSMQFRARALPIELDLSILDPLLAQARRLFDLKRVPSCSEGCKNCERLDSLIRMARS